MQRHGTCLCGAIKIEISEAPETAGACHCSMCRTWSGGVYLGLHLREDQARISGGEAITTYASSDWAERCFCKTCGTNLFYRVTAEGPMQGDLHMGLGLLEDANGISITEEIFIDQKPDGYAFAGETKKMTAAEVFAMFAPPEG